MNRYTPILSLLAFTFLGCSGQPSNETSSVASAPNSSSSSSYIGLSSSLESSSSSLSSASSSSAGPALTAEVFAVDSDAFCGGQGVFETSNEGFTGNSYFNGANASGASISWQVYADKSESYRISFRYANGGGDARTANLKVNGSVISELSFDPTSAWNEWALQTADVNLIQGDNEIRIEASSISGLANIDHLEIVGNGLSDGMCPEPVSSCAESEMADFDINALLSCSGNPTECVLGGGTGHYQVLMAFDESFTGNIEVYAESRRKMADQRLNGPAGEACVAFTVNVRDPEGEPIQNVPRGTPGLNLRIEQGGSELVGLAIKQLDNPVTLFIAGDSTVADQAPQLTKAPTSRFTGWGQFIPQYFNSAISIANYADSGEGTAAFRTNGGSLWQPINAGLKAGDWVFIQLGHNDKTTSAATYRSRINDMVTAIKAKSATPVLVSPMVRNTGGSISTQHIYGDLNVRYELTNIAQSQNVPFIDLMQLSSEWARQQGQSATQGFFVDNDRTHSNELGADVFAEMIVNEIRRQNIGLVDYLRFQQ